MFLKQWSVIATITIAVTVGICGGDDILLLTDFSSSNNNSGYRMGGIAAIKPANEVLGMSEGQVLYGDAFNASGEFILFFQTNLHLSGNAIYEVQFDYRIINSEDDAHLFALFASPSSRWSNAASGFTTLRDTGKTEHAKIRTVLTPTRDDFEFYLYATGKMQAAISNFKLTRLDRQAVLVNDVKPETSVVKVTGSNAFVIALPADTQGSVLSVADFGASPQLPDNTTAFAAAINQARQSKASKLIVPRGTYRFNDYKWSAMHFRDMTDFVFDGQGSDFIFYSNDLSPTYITIANCARSIFKNFTLDWDYTQKMIASRLEVTAINHRTGQIALKFADYEVVTDKNVPMNKPLAPLNNTTHEPGRLGESEIHIKSVKWINDNVVTATLSPNDPDSDYPRVGDNYACKHYSWNGQALNVLGSNHLTFDGVTVYASLGYGFRIVGTDDVQLLRCKVTKNPNMSPARVYSTNSDAFDYLNSENGNLLIENCEFAYSGDDYINLNPTSLSGMKYTDDRKTIIANSDFPKYSFRIGDVVEFRKPDFSPAGFTSVITEKKVISPTEAQVTFKDEVPEGFSALTIFFFKNYNIENFIIRDNYFHNGYCRGVLPVGRNGTIENNRFEKTLMPDLLIVNDYLTKYRIEGNGISNLLIKNNVFKDSNLMGVREGASVIYMPMWRPNTWYPINTGIEISGNRFIDPIGSVLFTSSVNGLTFRDNQIALNTPITRPLHWRGCAIVSAFSANFMIQGNRWHVARGTTESSGVLYSSDDTSNITITNNTLNQ